MRFIREFCFQGFIMIVILGLIFVAWDLSNPQVLSFSKGNTLQAVSSAIAPVGEILKDIAKSDLIDPRPDRGLFQKTLIPAIIYLLASGGSIYLLIENIRVFKIISASKPILRMLWGVWIIALMVMTAFPIVLGMALMFENLYMGIAWVIALVILSWSFVFLFKQSRP